MSGRIGTRVLIGWNEINVAIERKRSFFTQPGRDARQLRKHSLDRFGKLASLL